MIQQSFFMPSEMESLNARRVAVCGAGGVGGHVAATLVRMGVGTLTVIDGDTFEASNKNRQLCAVDSTLGQAKATVLEAHLRDINAEARITGVPDFVTDANFRDLLSGADLVVDCVDGSKNKRSLNEFCQALNIPYATGGIGGSDCRVSVITDYDKGYAYSAGKTENILAANPATVLVLSGLIAHEAVRFLLGQKPASLNRILLFRHMAPCLQLLNA